MASEADATAATPKASQSCRCQWPVANDQLCNRFFANISALRMHATKVHACDESDAEQYMIADQPLKPDLYRCLHPTSGLSAAASRSGSSAVCGQLMTTLQNLSDHLRGKAHRVAAGGLAKYTTAVPWDAVENLSATAAASAASSKSSARADGRRSSMHSAAAAAGVIVSLSKSGDDSDGNADADEHEASASEEEVAEESESDSDEPPSPLDQGYWRCMLPVHGGRCRRGFDSKTQMLHHFRRGHGRDPRRYSRRKKSSDFVCVPPPSTPDRYACSKKGCKFVHEVYTTVRSHLTTKHGVKDSKTRTEFTRVIEAEEPAPESEDEDEDESDEDDDSDALVRHPPKAPAGSANAGRVNRTSRGAVNRLLRSSTDGGTYTVQVQSSATASHGRSQSDNDMEGDEEAKGNGAAYSSFMPPQPQPSPQQKDRGVKRKHDSGNSAAAAGAPAAANPLASRPSGAINASPVNERSASSSVVGSAAAVNAAAAGAGADVVSDALQSKSTDELEREVKRRRLEIEQIRRQEATAAAALKQVETVFASRRKFELDEQIRQEEAEQNKLVEQARAAQKAAAVSRAKTEQLKRQRLELE
jgi:hypothetical protein